MTETTEKQLSCKDRVRPHWESRAEAFRAMLEAERRGNEEGPEEYGPLNEYGLSFDYVTKGTFNDQKRGYFRYQLSWGGPADEIRFYLDETLTPAKVEYWFLDWWDGACIDITGESLADEIWEWLSCDGDEFHLRGLIEKEE